MQGSISFDPNSHKTSIYAINLYDVLRWCVMVLEMASVGQCDGVRCLFGLIFTFFP